MEKTSLALFAIPAIGCGRETTRQGERMGQVTGEASRSENAKATDQRAVATLKNAAGETVGKATFTEASGGVTMVVEVNGLAAGSRGIHIQPNRALRTSRFQLGG